MPDLTHTAVGLTRSGIWPAGFRPARHRVAVGTGEAAFNRLAEAILTFELHRRAGLRVLARPRAVEGRTVVSGFGVGPLRLNAPCRVVWVEGHNKDDDDEDEGEDQGAGSPNNSNSQTNDDGGTRRAGFGYATLPGHPVSGEESFTVELAPGGTVYFELRAYSRHANWFYRLGAPVARFCQWLVTRRYLKAARRLANGSLMGH